MNLAEDYIYWALLARKDRFEMRDEKLRKLSSQETSALIKKMSANWHSSFYALLKLQDAAKTSITQINSVKPDIPTWDSSKHVTLIG